MQVTTCFKIENNYSFTDLLMTNSPRIFSGNM